MVDSRKKGARAELAARDLLRKYTGHRWERTPGSGALGVQHKLKGDLYIPNHQNEFLIEVKHYKIDQMGSIVLTHKEPTLFGWWDKAERQADETDKIPIVLYKWDRSKWYIIVPTDLVNTGGKLRNIRFKTEYNNHGSIFAAEDWLIESKGKVTW